MPKVSIIVPNYNYARFLPERMRSIFSQTYQDYEVILLDDCSTDNSKEILNRFSKNKKVSHSVFNKQNSGSPFSQWDKGVRLAQGEWIWIAEADDIADEHFLEILLKKVNDYPTVGLSYSHLQAINCDGNILWKQETHEDFFYLGSDFATKKLIYSTTIFNVSSCIFRKDVYNKIDSFEYRKYRHGGDYMFYIQLSEKTDVLEIGQILDSFRIHNDSTSHNVSINDKIVESFPMFHRLISRYNIPQHVFAMTYAKYEYENKYSVSDKLKILFAYIYNGMWLVPICFFYYYIKMMSRTINKYLRTFI